MMGGMEWYMTSALTIYVGECICGKKRKKTEEEEANCVITVSCRRRLNDMKESLYLCASWNH